ncbi:MAG: histidine kinase [Ferruginibacter sp.]|nr:histidine kinase [Ferruginibacter sp.]
MHNAAFFIKYKLHHLFIWMLIFGLWYFLRYEDFALESTAFKVTLVKVADLALMVYITNYLLIPKLLYKKRYFWFVLFFMLMIIAGSMVKMNILGRVMNNAALLNITGNLKARIYDNVIPHFFLVLAGAAIKLMVDYTRMQQRMVEMAKEKAEAELNFLKSQINPHFLFNSINSVYFLIDKTNTDARGALHKFSDMLRYQLYEMDGKQVAIEKEVQYLQDYIDLQKLRKNDQFIIQFNCTAEVKAFFIEPLLLVPLVENAFKHISHHKNSPDFIKINLSFQKGEFVFITENSREDGYSLRRATGDEHSGIGLTNVKRRLELLYPNRHSLVINDSKDIFKVVLTIKI